MSNTYFSNTYSEARTKFKNASAQFGAKVNSYTINKEADEDLTIDVASLGPEDAPTVVTSSGVHGVEGFFGSAIQLAFLDQLSQTGHKGRIRYVLIHGVNPFGFSQLRRWNEDNVDLNRNFMQDPDRYRGAPDGYADLNSFLNPETPPSRFEPFKLKALWSIWRVGLQKLKQAVAGGQYEYPCGLFFGGTEPSNSARIVFDNCNSWLGRTNKIAHIDFHSGLGEFGTYKLLLNESSSSPNLSWYKDTFGEDSIEPLTTPNGTAYEVSGLFGAWMQDHFKSSFYRFVAAEFGTYDVVRVLGALRAENRAHHYGLEESSAYKASKSELLECFCPRDKSWRSTVVESGLKLIGQASKAILEASPS